MAPLPLPRFAPDASILNTDALSIANNVVPRPDGWGPLRQIVPTPAIFDYLVDQDGNRLTDQNGDRLIVATDWGAIVGNVLLPDTATAFFAAKKRDGTEILFAGTDTALLQYDQTANVWVDVSSATYASAVPWVIVQFGDYVLAQNGFNTEQIYDVENDTEFSDNATAPICKAMAVVKNFVVRGNIVSWSSQSITNEPRMFQCSAIEDPTDNEPQNFNFSDYQTFATGTEIRAIVPFGDGCVVEMKDARYVANFVIDQFTFTSQPVDETRGTPAAYSIGLLGPSDYVMYRDDGFWRINLGGSKNIGEGKVNRYFANDCDQEERDTIRACVDPENLVCWFSYTDTNGDRKMLGYHYILDEWTESDIDVVVAAPARTFVYGTTITTAGLLRFALIDSNGQLGYLVGDNAQAAFGTNEVMHNGVNRAFVNGLRLITNASTYSVIVTTRDILGGTQRARAAATPSSLTGFVPIGAEGLSHKYDFTISAGTTWDTAVAIDAQTQPASQS